MRFISLFSTKTKAYSLPWAIMIMLIASIIITSVLITYKYSKHEIFQYHEVSNNIDDINSALNICKNSRRLLLNDSIKLNSTSYVHYEKRPWGMLSVNIATINKLSSIKSKTILSGNFVEANSLPSLVIKQARNKIHFGGDCQIRGSIYVPKGEIEKSIIEGQGISKVYFDKTKVFTSEKFNESFMFEAFTERLKEIAIYSKTKLDFEKNLKDSIINSFSNTTLYLHSMNKITLLKNYFEGNIVISSDSSIIVNNDCNLKNIILVAPSIKIDSKFIGSLQIFATDTVIIGKKVVLKYPTIIVLSSSENNQNGQVLLDEDSELNGSIFNVCANKNQSSKDIIKTKTNSIINGAVFSTSSVDIQGNVNGIVFSNTTMASTKSSINFDFIYNCKIDKYKLLDYILFPCWRNNSKEIEIINL